jgi:small subunit ribosomal protein S4
VREGSKDLTYFKDLPALAESKAVSPWLTRDIKTLSGSVTRLPERSEIDGNLQEQLIVEYYSR